MPLPPRQGRAGLRRAAARARRRGHGAGAAPELARRSRARARVARQRALVAVVSDFRGPRDWRPPLVDLAGRHDVLAVEIRDPREEQLVDVGEVWFSDPETGRELRVDTGDARPARTVRRGRRRRSGGMSRISISQPPCVPRRPLDERRLAARPRRAPAGGAGELRQPRSRCSACSSCPRSWRCSWSASAGARRRARGSGRLRSSRRRAPAPRRLRQAAAVRARARRAGRADRRAWRGRGRTLSLPGREATVVLAIDTSRSMAATDVQPSRLAAALAAARAFLDVGAASYSVGIVTFSTRASLVLTPTTDRDAARAGARPDPARLGHGARGRDRPLGSRRAARRRPGGAAPRGCGPGDGAAALRRRADHRQPYSRLPRRRLRSASACPSTRSRSGRAMPLSRCRCPEVSKSASRSRPMPADACAMAHATGGRYCQAADARSS